MKFAQLLKARRPRLEMRLAGVSVLTAVGLLAWTGNTAAAGETSAGAVLEIEVKIEAGHERWKNGSEWKDGAFSQSYTLNIPYTAAPSLDSFNPYDLDYAAASLRAAAAAQARAAGIARQDGDRTASPFDTVLDPSKMIQVDPERMAELAERSKACGGDRTCLMQLGLEMMARNAAGQDAAILQKMQQISDDCGQTVDMSDSQALDACLQHHGSKYAMSADGADLPDSGPGFAEPGPDRFQRWEVNWGSEGDCGATIVADYRYQAADLLNDVTGPVVGSETAIGTSEGAVIPSEAPVVCSSNQIITDIRTRRMYIQSFYMPTIPVHHTIVSKLRGGTLESAATGGLPGGSDIVKQETVMQWITEQLKNASLSGHAERAFKIKGNMNGVSLPTNAAGAEEIVPDETDPTAWKRQAADFHETEFLAKVTWRLKELRP